MRRRLFALLLFLLVGRSPAAASEPLLEIDAPRYFETGAYPVYALTADFNEDGMLDVVTADRSGRTVTVLLGDTTALGRLIRDSSYAVHPEPFGLAVADFNEDGILDIASANNDSDDVAILLGGGAAGVGDGTFGPASHYSSGRGAYSIAVGDYDGDDILDLAVANDEEDSLAILLGNGAGGVGDGSFALSHKYPTGERPQSVIAAHLSGDEILDLVVVNAHTDNALVFLGNGSGGEGDGTFQAPVSYGVGDGPHSVLAIDVNGDGILDLASPGWNSDNMAVLIGNGAGGVGDGTFQTAVFHSVGDEPRRVISGDWNGDEAVDLAASEYDGRSFSILFGDGEGSFAPVVRFEAGGQCWSIESGHFNGDPYLDILTVNPAMHGGNLVRGRGDGTFHTFHTAPVGRSGTSLAVADFDGDGHADFAANESDSSRVHVLAGDGAGNFASVCTVSVGAGPQAIAATHADGDSLLDLVGACSDGGVISLARGNGDGTFQTAEHTPVPSDPYDLVTGDWNEDGFVDLAIAHRGIDSLTVLLGAGTGAFEIDSVYATGGTPFALVSADLDGDDVLDLVLLEREDESLHVFLGVGVVGVGSGVFASGPKHAVGAGPNDLIAGDMNGDEIVDLVVPCGQDDEVEVLLGAGDGTFAPPLAYELEGTGWQASIADVSGDGEADVVVANQWNGTVTVLVGSGEGDFPERASYGVGRTALAVAAGNFDGEGEIDLVVIGSGRSEARVLLNKTIGLTVGAPEGEPPPRARLPLQIRPNPFNPAGSVRFTLAEGAHASLRVYDVSGRVIRILLEDPLPAGFHEILWDGRDGRGRPAPSGIYLLRLEGTGPPRTGKALLLR